MTSFDADNSGQTLVAGTVDTSSGSVSCPSLTNSKIGVISFLGLLNT